MGDGGRRRDARPGHRDAAVPTVAAARQLGPRAARLRLPNRDDVAVRRRCQPRADGGRRRLGRAAQRRPARGNLLRVVQLPREGAKRDAQRNAPPNPDICMLRGPRLAHTRRRKPLATPTLPPVHALTPCMLVFVLAGRRERGRPRDGRRARRRRLRPQRDAAAAARAARALAPLWDAGMPHSDVPPPSPPAERALAPLWVAGARARPARRPAARSGAASAPPMPSPSDPRGYL